MQTPDLIIHVDVPAQRLDVLREGALVRSFPISTSAYGLGSEPGSMMTPTGKLRVAEKIGDGAPPGAVFRSREQTGEIGAEEVIEDLVQTRILWLEGLEEQNANTYDRYIYIHGTNHEASLGQAASHGCIRMRNVDVIELFDLVEPGAEVFIQP